MPRWEQLRKSRFPFRDMSESLGMYKEPRYLPAGDRALVVELGNAISPDINRMVRDLFLAIEERNIDGIVDLMPSYRSILIYYDPTVISLSRLKEEMETVQSSALQRAVSQPRLVHIPTLYGGDRGPDLDFVAQHSGLTTLEVVSIHSGTNYLVYMLGFSPGFPFLGGMPERISTPRLESPRTAVPAGSVGIAGRQTGVYPVETPGGWRIIGQTPLRFFYPDREPPTIVEPGDYIRFVSIEQDEYEDIQRQVEEGSYNTAAKSAM